MIAHWDGAAAGHAEAGHIAGEWTNPGNAAGANGVCSYARSSTISLRGLGPVARLEDLDDHDGEPS